jgi:hypothetical protein
MAGPSEDAKSAAKPPIIVDLGKKRRKQVKKLRRGTGKLMDEVNGTLQELKNAGTITSNSQPVVVVVRERRRGSKNPLLWPL